METSELKIIARKCEIFKTLDDEDLDLLLFYGEQKEVSSGAILYRSGEAAEGTFCLILSGRIQITNETGQMIRNMASGEVIGEIGATSPQSQRTVTARTTSPTSLLEWDVKYIKNRWPALLKRLKEQAWKHLAQYYDSGKR